jgi:hypothetical protein
MNNILYYTFGHLHLWTFTPLDIYTFGHLHLWTFKTPIFSNIFSNIYNKMVEYLMSGVILVKHLFWSFSCTT